MLSFPFSIGLPNGSAIAAWVAAAGWKKGHWGTYFFTLPTQLRFQKILKVRSQVRKNYAILIASASVLSFCVLNLFG
jgi:hypothetical protein